MPLHPRIDSYSLIRCALALLVGAAGYFLVADPETGEFRQYLATRLYLFGAGMCVFQILMYDTLYVPVTIRTIEATDKGIKTTSLFGRKSLKPLSSIKGVLFDEGRSTVFIVLSSKWSRQVGLRLRLRSNEDLRKLIIEIERNTSRRALPSDLKDQTLLLFVLAIPVVITFSILLLSVLKLVTNGGQELQNVTPIQVFGLRLSIALVLMSSFTLASVGRAFRLLKNVEQQR